MQLRIHLILMFPNRHGGKMELEVLSSHDTNVFQTGRFRVLPSSGDVVVQARATEFADWKFYIYKLKYGHLQRRSIKGSCDHSLVGCCDLLALFIDGQEIMAISCVKCEDLKLVDPDTGETTVVYKSIKYKPYTMCHGDAGRLWVQSCTDGFPVIELSCSQRTFTETGRTVLPCSKSYYMCCLPPPNQGLMFSNHKDERVWAVSPFGSVLWEFRSSPSALLGLVFSHVILVADYWNGRITVLRPSDGSLVGTLPVPDRLEDPYEICLYRNQLVILSGKVHLHRSKICFCRITAKKLTSGKKLCCVSPICWQTDGNKICCFLRGAKARVCSKVSYYSSACADLQNVE